MYLTLIQSLSFVCLIIYLFITIDGSAAILNYLRASISCLLSALMTLSAAVFNFLLGAVFFVLSVSMILSATIFNSLSTSMSSIKLIHLHQTILQDLLIISKICWII